MQPPTGGSKLVWAVGLLVVGILVSILTALIVWIVLTVTSPVGSDPLQQFSQAELHSAHRG